MTQTKTQLCVQGQPKLESGLLSFTSEKAHTQRFGSRLVPVHIHASFIETSSNSLTA